MKVYQINVVCGYGSTGRIVVDLSEAIRLRDGNCRIAYGRKGSPADDIDSIKIGCHIEVLTHVILSRITGRHGLYSKKTTRKMIGDIKKYNPDIIHLHNIHGYYLNYKMLFSFLKQYGRPVIWTMHDCWAFTGHCAHYEGVNCDGWLKGCHFCPNTYVYPRAYSNYNTGNNYDQKKEAFIISNLNIIAPSNWLKEQLGRSFLKEIPCTVIHNGIDLTAFRYVGCERKRKLGIADKKMILGVASIWTEYKGLYDLIEIAKRVSSQYVVCMVGLDKKHMEHLPHNVIGIERTENLKELVEYYSAADVYLNLTYEDTFPTTNIEALACGTPVITYRTGGSAEIIVQECGAIVEKGDIEAVINQAEIWANRSCREECRKRAMLYGKDTCYEKYLLYYAEVMKKQFERNAE